jgi:hemoglobin
VSPKLFNRIKFYRLKEIETRKDISILVHTFYAKIRKNDLLGPIFNSHIAENQWP